MISPEKRIWSEQEDIMLKKLYQQQNERNWGTISKKMHGEFDLPRKSAKQCRERYENHISADIIKVEWTQEEEIQLIDLHNQIGNKWSLIANSIPGKNDNCVKNHFYSKLRKVLRKLNAIIHNYLKKQFKEIHINTLYKIVECCEEMFKERPGCDGSASLACREVQNRMLHLSMLHENNFDSIEQISIYRELIRDVYTVSKLYKRKSKKTRQNSMVAPRIKQKEKKKRIILIKNNNNNEENDNGYESDKSSFEDEDDMSPREKKRNRQFDSPGEYVQRDQFSFKVKPVKPEVESEQQGIKYLLLDAGLLQTENVDARKNAFKPFNLSSRSSFKSFKSLSENQDSEQIQFFQESQAQNNRFGNRKKSVFHKLDDYSDKSQRDAMFFNADQ